ncbi:hypothetical protein, partial [Tepidimonas sp.]|uniref:hypothetical protein n=1 Tax=Tepidimonas sp. TaxID=2002775 RepID=UPI00391D0857
AEYAAMRQNPSLREQAAMVAEELQRRGFKTDGDAPTREPYREQEERTASSLLDDPEAFLREAHRRSPLAALRQGVVRDRVDIEQMTAALDDWGGPRPWEIAPRAETAVRLPDDAPMRPRIDVRPGKSADELAREIDPETFRVFDELAKRKDTYRRWLQELEGPRERDTLAAVADIDDKIDAMREKIAGASARNAKRYGAELDELTAQREAIVAEMKTTDTPDMAHIRKVLMDDDFRMRELAPMVSRAYARAREQWQLDEAGREGLRQMIREGRTLMPQAEMPEARTTVGAEPHITERVPLLATRPDVMAAASATDDAATLAAKVIEQNAKALDEALDAEMAAVKTLLESEDGTLRLNGQETTLRLDDKIAMPIDDGEGFREMTVRGLLDDMQRDADEIKAVTTCSIKRPS